MAPRILVSCGRPEVDGLAVWTGPAPGRCASPSSSGWPPRRASVGPAADWVGAGLGSSGEGSAGSAGVRVVVTAGRSGYELLGGYGWLSSGWVVSVDSMVSVDCPAVSVDSVVSVESVPPDPVSCRGHGS